jgi:hypothetical protein
MRMVRGKTSSDLNNTRHAMNLPEPLKLQAHSRVTPALFTWINIHIKRRPNDEHIEKKWGGESGHDGK